MKKLLLSALIIFTTLFINAQNVTVSGYIEDVGSGERLIGANIFDATDKKYGTSTNSYGFFSLTLPKGKHAITVTYIGYGFWQTEMDLTKDTNITIQISTDIKLKQVVIQAKHNQVESSQMGRVDVPISMIKSLPAMFGEVDVLKTIQLLPGVQSGTEGSSGVYVRGGGPDQNLILLDGVPVYNANHLFGFFSVFNADAISNVSLYKGGFPARFGGRLSSVIDINLKEGNMKKFTGNVSIGLISSKFTFEGPIKIDKTSFIISARRTYIDVLVNPFITIAQKIQDPSEKIRFSAGYYFYDFNAKINHKISNKDRVFFSLYGGQDKAYSNASENEQDYKYKNKMRLGWGNIISALRWNHVFTPKLFGNLTFTYSRFNFLTELSNEESYTPESGIENTSMYSVSYDSGIYDWSAKLDFDYNLNNNHKIKYGANATYHTFHPGATNLFFKYSSLEIDTTFGGSDLNALEFAAYLEDDIRIGKRIKINVGGRLSAFKVRDTMYFLPEPRISGRIMITDNWSVKASYAQMQQYLHFLTNNTVGMPTDLWLPATDKVLPQKSIQYAVGTSFGLTDKITIVLEGFYKEMDNLVELDEGESIFGDFASSSSVGNSWETRVVQGEGWSYGGEILVKKDIGQFTGWIGYTLSWSMRKFTEISFGQVFPYRYDRRHDISVVGLYKLNDSWSFGATFVYGSGNPVTLSQMKILSLNSATSYSPYGDEVFDYFGKRNNYRLPSYHRLDISANWTKDVRWGKRTWSFGVYNAYNHLNPFFVEIDNYEEDNIPKLIIYSIFPLMPSFSYNIKF